MPLLVDPQLEGEPAISAYRSVLGWAARTCDRFAILLEVSRNSDPVALAALRGVGRPAKVTLAKPIGGLASLFFGAYRYEQREGKPNELLVDVLTRFSAPPGAPGDLCPASIVALSRGDRTVYWCGDYGRDQVLHVDARERAELESAMGGGAALVAAR
jgi:hypothetical protein